MEKTISVSLLALMGAFAATSAHAEGKSRFNVGVNVYTQDEADLDVTLTSIVGRYNHTVASNGAFDFGLEGELSYGIIGDDVSVPVFESTVDVDVDAEFGAAAFATAAYNFTETGSNVFVRLGYAYQEVEASAGGISEGAEGDGFAYGIGTNVMFNAKHGIRGDWTRLDGDDSDADLFSVSYVFRY